MSRAPVTVVCVFNDEAVRRACLDRSIEALRPTAPATEYLPLDNTDGRFASAGAALNEGARRARNPVVVMAHQDVVLHSLVAAERAAWTLLTDPHWGVLGPIGIDGSGDLVGRLRDRLVPVGRQVRTPTRVDSLDEALFLATTERLRAEPLAEEPDLAWHAYAVEYGLRSRADGREVGAVPLPITHNSLTINLARLEHAHAAVAGAHPTALPVVTTCGTIATDAGRRQPIAGRVLRSRRWREPVGSGWAGAVAGTRRVRRLDVRRELDDLLDEAGAGPLEVINLVADDDLFAGGPPLELRRRDRTVTVHTLAPAEGLARAVGTDPASALLLTGLRSRDLAALRPHLRRHPHLLLVHSRLRPSVLLGPPAA